MILFTLFDHMVVLLSSSASFEYFIFNYLYQVSSCYGLLSTGTISDPVKTGTRVTLPYYSGCQYVAFAARSSQEVGIFVI